MAQVKGILRPLTRFFFALQTIDLFWRARLLSLGGIFNRDEPLDCALANFLEFCIVLYGFSLLGAGRLAEFDTF